MNFVKEILELLKKIFSSNATSRKTSIKILAFIIVPTFIIFFNIFYFISNFINIEWLILIINSFFDMIVLIIFFVSLFYYITRKINKIFKYSKNDIFKQDNYYRDIILNYGLAELSYIDNFKLDNNKDVVAILLSMESKGIISFNNNKIKITNETKKLKKSEKYILSLVKRKSLCELDVEKLKEETINDCIEDGLLYIINKKACFFCLCINSIIIMLSYFISFRYSAYIFYFSIIIFSLIITMIIDPYRRTKSGIEINRKLEGLKNFLKDFTLMDKKEHKELLLWDDYLVYSVLFGQNKRIVEEVLKSLK